MTHEKNRIFQGDVIF